jgi:L-threonylcarbamoyladenylate synthase
MLLRPGAISRQELEALIGPISSAQEVKAGPHPAPGMHPRHYSPRTNLLLVENGKVPVTGRGIYLQHSHPPKLPNIEAKIGASITIIPMPRSAPDYAAALYEALHQADAANADWIAVDSPPTTPEWEAVQDRLKRAAASE